MEIIRIGEKLINTKKINLTLEQIFNLRSQGFSQQETARRLGVDRSFISRLETLGEIRRGMRIAVVGFPVANKEELQEMLQQEAVEYILLLSDAERWDLARNKNGLELFNYMMEVVAELRNYDVVIMIGSDYRIKVAEALLGREVVGFQIGTSPIQGDRKVDIKKLRWLIQHLATDEEMESE